MEDEEILEGNINIGSTYKKSRIVLHPAHFANKSAFKKTIGDLGAGWVGTENQIQELKVLLSLKDCPKFTGEPKLGIHKLDGEWVLVSSDKSIALDKEIDNVTFWNELSQQTKYEISDLKDIDHKDLSLIAEALINFNNDYIQAGVVGWMMALPFKARLVNAVPTVRRQFPILNLWGERGAGKTQTRGQDYITVLRRLRRIEENRRNDQVTLMLSAHATNLLPRIYDEYKPSKLMKNKAAEVSSFLRAVYDSQTGERGFSNNSGQGTVSYTYTAPVALVGEQILYESALKERITELFFYQTRQAR